MIKKKIAVFYKKLILISNKIALKTIKFMNFIDF